MTTTITITGCAATAKTEVKQEKKQSTAYQLFWPVLPLETVLYQYTQFIWVITESGDDSEEPEDYPFDINPAGYTSRSVIVICK